MKNVLNKNIVLKEFFTGLKMHDECFEIMQASVDGAVQKLATRNLSWPP